MPDVKQVVQQVQHRLHQAGIDSPEAEAAIIVSHVLGIDRGRLGVLQILGETIDSGTAARIGELVAARSTRVPLQQLLGVAAFYGLELSMAPGVFIPRAETETLVETTLEQVAKTHTAVSILDLCTGSGAIAAALADQLHHRNIPADIWAVDLNPQAVELTRQNTTPYNVTVVCADATSQASMLDAAPELAHYLGCFDAVVTNPPYVPTDTPVTQAEAEHDPHLALYGGSTDGTSIPLVIADQAAGWLASGGFFMMEHDHTHADIVAETLGHIPSWQAVRTVADLTQTPRFVSAIRT